MRQEDKTSITVSKETRRELKSLLLQVQAERDESLSQDDLLKLLMDYYKSRNWGTTWAHAVRRTEGELYWK